MLQTRRNKNLMDVASKRGKRHNYTAFSMYLFGSKVLGKLLSPPENASNNTTYKCYGKVSSSNGFGASIFK